MSRQAARQPSLSRARAAGTSGSRIAPEDETFDVQVLVERAQDDDELAFSALYLIFFRRIYRYLVVRLGNADDAQEVAHDVFERLLGILPDYDPARGQFPQWIFSIARNLATDHVRKANRLSGVPLDPADEQLVERAATLVSGIENGANFQSIIEGLPREQRRILTLRYVYDLSAAEIADVIGANSAAVRQAQCRALRALASRMTRPQLEA